MRRLLAGLAATAAVATSLLISSAGPATAADSAAGAPEASAANAQTAGVTANKDLPLDIRVTDPNLKIVATLRGVGKQIYDCAPSATTYTFREPAAGLFTLRGATRRTSMVKARSGPTSTARGSTAQQDSCSVAQPGTSNVPWLLLTKTKSRGRRHVRQRRLHPAHRHQGRPASGGMQRAHGRRGLRGELRVLGIQVTITPPNRRDGRPPVAAVRRFAYLRRRKSRPSSDRASEIRRLRPFATVWSIPREPECCHPARVLGRRPS